MEIILQDWKLTEGDTFSKLAQNSNMQYMRSYKSNISVNEAYRLIKDMLNDKQNGLYKAIVVDGNICGHIEIKKADFCDEQTCTISYFLRADYEHHGIMKKAVSLITTLAFNTLNVTSIKAYVASENIASIKVLESNGFTLSSTFCDKSSSLNSSVTVNIYVLNK